MDESILKKLYETFELRERKGTGGMMFKYVPNEDVINRMNKVFEGNWSTKIVDKKLIDDQVMVEVQVTVYDSASEVIYTHTGFGSQHIMRYNGGPNDGKIIDIGNAYKGALAKGIVNACTRWGVGLFKESNPYELGDDVLTDNESYPTAVPPAAPAAKMPMPAAVPTTTISKPSAPPAAPPAAIPAAPPVAAAPPAAPTAAPPAAAPVILMKTTTAAAPPVPGQQISTSLGVVQKDIPSPGPTRMPNFPAPNVNTAPVTPDLPMSSAPAGNLNAVGISDVQRVALNGILSMHKANYDELAREAFDSKGMDQTVPVKENLSYEEAVVVIKYGNDKFRKNR